MLWRDLGQILSTFLQDVGTTEGHTLPTVALSD
jgi:hypothetical protein